MSRFRMQKMNLQAQLITATSTQALRHLVLWPHLASPACCTLEADDDPMTFHMGCFHRGELRGIATLVSDRCDGLPDGTQMRLRAMATHPEFRGHNVGLVLINGLLGELYTRKVDWVWCDARVTAVGFYERVGWEVDSQVYHVPQVGAHRRAYCRIVTPV